MSLPSLEEFETRFGLKKGQYSVEQRWQAVFEVVFGIYEQSMESQEMNEVDKEDSGIYEQSMESQQKFVELLKTKLATFEQRAMEAKQKRQEHVINQYHNPSASFVDQIMDEYYDFKRKRK